MDQIQVLRKILEEKINAITKEFKEKPNGISYYEAINKDIANMVALIDNNDYDALLNYPKIKEIFKMLYSVDNPATMDELIDVYNSYLEILKKYSKESFVQVKLGIQMLQLVKDELSVLLTKNEEQISVLENELAILVNELNTYLLRIDENGLTVPLLSTELDKLKEIISDNGLSEKEIFAILSQVVLENARIYEEQRRKESFKLKVAVDENIAKISSEMGNDELLDTKESVKITANETIVYSSEEEKILLKINDILEQLKRKKVMIDENKNFYIDDDSISFEERIESYRAAENKWEEIYHDLITYLFNITEENKEERFKVYSYIIEEYMKDIKAIEIPSDLQQQIVEFEDLTYDLYDEYISKPAKERSVIKEYFDTYKSFDSTGRCNYHYGYDYSVEYIELMKMIIEVQELIKELNDQLLILNDFGMMRKEDNVEYFSNIIDELHKIIPICMQKYKTYWDKQKREDDVLEVEHELAVDSLEQTRNVIIFLDDIFEVKPNDKNYSSSDDKTDKYSRQFLSSLELLYMMPITTIKEQKSVKIKGDYEKIFGPRRMRKSDFRTAFIISKISNDNKSRLGMKLGNESLLSNNSRVILVFSCHEKHGNKDIYDYMNSSLSKYNKGNSLQKYMDHLNESLTEEELDELAAFARLAYERYTREIAELSNVSSVREGEMK